MWWASTPCCVDSVSFVAWTPRGKVHRSVKESTVHQQQLSGDASESTNVFKLCVLQTKVDLSDVFLFHYVCLLLTKRTLSDWSVVSTIALICEQESGTWARASRGLLTRFCEDAHRTQELLYLVCYSQHIYVWSDKSIHWQHLYWDQAPSCGYSAAETRQPGSSFKCQITFLRS